MKKIDVILRKGTKPVAHLSELKKKGIYRTIEAAKDYAEEQRVMASLNYEKLFDKFAEDNICYNRVISEMVRLKEIILNAVETLEALKQIEQDLQKEIEEADAE